MCAVWDGEGGWGRESSQFPLRKLPKGRARGMAKHSTPVSGFPFPSTHPNSLPPSANAAAGSSSGIRSRRGGGEQEDGKERGRGGGRRKVCQNYVGFCSPRQPLIRHSSAAGGRRDKLYVRPLFRGISVSCITLPAGPFPILRTLKSGFLKRDLVLHFRVILPIQVILGGIRSIGTDLKGNKK